MHIFRVFVSYTRDRATIRRGISVCSHGKCRYNVIYIYIHIYIYITLYLHLPCEHNVIYKYIYVYRSPGKWLGVSVSVAYESGPCGILRTRRVRICMCVSWLFCCPRCGRMARRSTFSSRSLILFFHPSSSISRIGLSVVSLYRVRVSYIHAIPFLRYLKIYSPQDGCRPN